MTVPKKTRSAADNLRSHLSENSHLLTIEIGTKRTYNVQILLYKHFDALEFPTPSIFPILQYIVVQMQSEETLINHRMLDDSVASVVNFSLIDRQP